MNIERINKTLISAAFKNKKTINKKRDEKHRRTVLEV
jgi:hypothetical protein